MSAKNKTSEEFEKLIHAIYQELEPHADVKWNDQIEGMITSTMRQIDVSVRTTVGSHSILIVIQAKDYKRAADINTVGEFIAVIEDVGASKGILICNAGFTRKAIEYAKRKKIDVCSAHDATKVKWQTKIEIPVIKRSIKVKLTVRHSFAPIQATSLNRVSLSHPRDNLNEFIALWERGGLSKEPGEHKVWLTKDKDIEKNKDLMHLGTEAEYIVEHRHHFKFFVPKDYRGIRDFVSQKFTPSFIQFEEDVPFLNDGSWKYIENPADISINALHLDIEMVHIDVGNIHLMRITMRE